MINLPVFANVDCFVCAMYFTTSETCSYLIHAITNWIIWQELHAVLLQLRVPFKYSFSPGVKLPRIPNMALLSTHVFTILADLCLAMLIAYHRRITTFSPTNEKLTSPRETQYWSAHHTICISVAALILEDIPQGHVNIAPTSGIHTLVSHLGPL